MNTLLKEFSSDSMKQNFKLRHLLPFFFFQAHFLSLPGQVKTIPCFKAQEILSQCLEYDWHSSHNFSKWQGPQLNSCVSPPCYTEMNFHGYQLSCLEKERKKIFKQKGVESISSSEITKSSLCGTHACLQM